MEAFEKRIPILEQIADGEHLDVIAASFEGTISWEPVPAKAGDRVRAVAELARVGLGPAVRTEDVRERLQQTLAVLRAHMAPDAFTALVPRLREVWR